MALTVSHIEADFVKDTKTIGKQSAYLEFLFGDRHHVTDTLKSVGKFATWDTPVQLTGAGITMKIIAKASKSLAKDKPLGVAELNLVQVAGKGMQTVQLHDTVTGEHAGEVRLQISGGSPAISGLPHTEGHGLGSGSGGMLGHNSQQGHEGHHHGAETAAGVGAAGLGAEALHHHHKQDQQQGVPQEGHHGHKGELAAGTGAAGLGAAALHHHHQNQGVGQQYDHNTGLGGQQYGNTSTGIGQNTGTGYGAGTGQNTGAGIGQNTTGTGYGGQQYNQTGVGGQNTGIGGQNTGVGGENTGIGGQNTGAGTCPQCSGTGSVAQCMEQGLHLGGQRQQGTY